MRFCCLCTSTGNYCMRIEESKNPECVRDTQIWCSEKRDFSNRMQLLCGRAFMHKFSLKSFWLWSLGKYFVHIWDERVCIEWKFHEYFPSTYPSLLNQFWKFNFFSPKKCIISSENNGNNMNSWKKSSLFAWMDNIHWICWNPHYRL